MVVNQNGNSWSLPKGHIEPGEDEVAAAIREVYEEAGIKEVRVIKKLGQYERYRIGLSEIEDKAILKSITIYLMTTNEVDLQPLDPHNPEARWVKPDEVESLLTNPKDKAFYAGVLPEVKQFIATLQS